MGCVVRNCRIECAYSYLHSKTRTLVHLVLQVRFLTRVWRLGSRICTLCSCILHDVGCFLVTSSRVLLRCWCRPFDVVNVGTVWSRDIRRSVRM